MTKREMSVEELLDHLYRGSSTKPDLQAEMNARDLRELVPGSELERKERPNAASTTKAAEDSARAATNSIPELPSDTNETPAESQRSSSPILIGLSIAVIGTIVFGALYELPTRVDSTSFSIAAASEATDRTSTLGTAPEVEAESVLFANPFDESEVFEFPHGTSEGEARDAVANFLLERALERQAGP